MTKSFINPRHRKYFKEKEEVFEVSISSALPLILSLFSFLFCPLLVV